VKYTTGMETTRTTHSLIYGLSVRNATEDFRKGRGSAELEIAGFNGVLKKESQREAKPLLYK